MVVSPGHMFAGGKKTFVCLCVCMLASVFSLQMSRVMVNPLPDSQGLWGHHFKPGQGVGQGSKASLEFKIQVQKKKGSILSTVA